MKKPKAIYCLDNRAFDVIYGPKQRKKISERLHIQDSNQTRESLAQDPTVLRDVEIILGGWGMPPLCEDLLSYAPALKAVFYGAGSVRYFVTDAFWARGILLTSAYAANSIPVAEFCVAQILFSLKLGWRYMRYTRETHEFERAFPVPGAYGTAVGLISIGMIARKVLELLKPYSVNIAVYSTSMQSEEAEKLGVTLCGLPEIFERCHVVSLHTPDLPSTRGMITKEYLLSMPKDGTFINTARGRVVDEQGLIDALVERPDLTAALDVTYPEPPVQDSPLFTLPNVVLTPHIAGSLNSECHRMSDLVVEEIDRYLSGRHQLWPLDRKAAERLA